MEKGLKRFIGKTAFITGAGSGIGRGIALRLAEEGAEIAVCDIVEEKVRETVALIKERAQKGIALVCDVGKEEEITTTAHQVLERLGKVDILVNNAGTGDTNLSFEEVSAELWDRVYAINVKGPFLLSKIIAKDMIGKKIKGRIIYMSSTEGKTNRAGSLAYSSSKHALIGLTQGLAIQLAPYEITVNAICPGLIDTPIYHKADREMDLPPGSMIKMIFETALEQRHVWIPRLGAVEDIAGAVAFLASDEASYMTGQAINVCGGMEFH